MIESIFSKIYSYREKENTNSKENFIIEIFAHCLSTDSKLLDDFLDILNLSADEKASIKTQSIYEYGRPDIEINLPSTKTCILIECKIEHFERPNQLEDYKKILENKLNTKKHLVYLTKYYDFRENYNNKIKLHLKKWFDIYQLIDENNTLLSLELKSYIKDENMSESKNFTYTDLTALKNITGTIRKMDEVLDGVKEYYETKIGILAKESARSTRLKYEMYSTFQGFGHSSTTFHFVIFFEFKWDDDEIWLGTRIWISTADKYKKTNEYVKLFKRFFKTWEVDEEFENCAVISNYKPIAQFIIEDVEQIPEMVKFLKQGVDKMETLRKHDPKIFK